MTERLLTIAPFAQLGRFAAVAGLLLVCWDYLSPIYLATHIPLANHLLAWEHLPFAFQLHENQLLLACRQPDGSLHRFLFTGHDIPSLTIAVAIALFVATPGYGIRWRLGWLAGAITLFSLLNGLILYAGALLTIRDYLANLPADHLRQLLPAGAEFSVDNPPALDRLIGLWSIWGSPALLLALWFFAARDRYLPRILPSAPTTRSDPPPPPPGLTAPAQ